MAARGQQQRGRSTAFNADRPLRASVLFDPGDPDRAIYEQLVVTLGVSGAEVTRMAYRALAREVARQQKAQRPHGEERKAS